MNHKKNAATMPDAIAELLITKTRKNQRKAEHLEATIELITKPKKNQRNAENSEELISGSSVEHSEKLILD